MPNGFFVFFALIGGPLICIAFILAHPFFQGASMTTEPKFDTYLFTRAEGFYPVHITKESVAANIEHNPGTLKVEEYSRDGQHKTIWTQADGWLDSEYAAMFGSQHDH